MFLKRSEDRTEILFLVHSQEIHDEPLPDIRHVGRFGIFACGSHFVFLISSAFDGRYWSGVFESNSKKQKTRLLNRPSRFPNFIIIYPNSV